MTDTIGSRPRALEGRVCVVTGGGSGIGRAIAERLSADGGQLALLGRRSDVLESAGASLRAFGAVAVPVVCDIADEGSIVAAFETVDAELGQPDLLVNNAAQHVSGSVLDLSADDWDQLLTVNVRGTFLCLREAARRMKTRGRGNVVNLVSVYGMRPQKENAAYGAAKAAVIHLTRVAALELAPFGIRVNAVAPGYVTTEMFDVVLQDEQLSRALLRLVPQGRFADAVEIADAVGYLAGDASRHVTGSVLTIDGGLSLR
jgi:NAD(P)-dependent dehydrogenase (short-subunit alcohol dehydrogenase family)